MTFDIYTAQDRRPTGGLITSAEPHVVTAGQAVDAWMRGSAIVFDAEIERVAAAAS